MTTIENLPVAEISEQHMQGLVTAGATESQTLEFKQELKLGSDADKREFCTDITSFANAAGGLVLYGVRAKDGVATEIVGLQATSADDLLLQIEQVLHAGISPRLPWKEIRAIPLSSSSNVVIAIRLQRSAIAPHAAGRDGTFRFVTRVSSGKLAMDIPQVRASFLLSEGLRERLRIFRAERMAKIIATDGIVRLTPGQKLILHLVPLSSLSEPREYHLASYADPRNQSLLSLGSRFPGTREFNIDGVVDIARQYGMSEATGYAQLFQSGIIEAADSEEVLRRMDSQDKYKHSMSASWFVSHLNVGLGRYLAILRELQVEVPVYLLITMTGMRNLAMWTSNHHKLMKLCDRDVLVFPEVLITNLSVEPHSIAHPIHNALWRTFGHKECPWYHADGSFEIPRDA